MRVLLADGHAKVRSAMRLLLQQLPGIEVLGEAVDTRGVMDWATAACPDVMLLDWELPGVPISELLDTLHVLCPRLRVVALSGRPEARNEALAAGVEAFVSKGDPPHQLLQVLAQLMGNSDTLLLSNSRL